jgi:hypothetical protein
MTKIQIDYYKLLDNKEMGDGKTIPQRQELILIKEDSDGLLFFETHNDDYKKLFWAPKEEVDFVESLQEDWSDDAIKERKNYINGEFV